MAAFIEAVQLGLMAFELPFMTVGAGFLLWEILEKLGNRD